jgi:hypothetical protein
MFEAMTITPSSRGTNIIGDVRGRPVRGPVVVSSSMPVHENGGPMTPSLARNSSMTVRLWASRSSRPWASDIVVLLSWPRPCGACARQPATTVRGCPTEATHV